MSQIAPRVAAQVATPLSGAGMALASAASGPATAAANPTAVTAPRAAPPASPTAPAVTTETTPVSADAARDAATATASATPAARADPMTPIAGGAVANAAAPATATAVPATTAVVPAKPTGTTAQVGTAAPLPQSPATAGSLGGAVFALVLVVGLILALAWLAKRLPGVAGSSNPALRIVGSLSLGPRERVVVVAIGDTQLLLGVGAGGTRTLHTLSEPLPVAASTTPAFAQLLAQHFGKKA